MKQGVFLKQYTLLHGNHMFITAFTTTQNVCLHSCIHSNENQHSF